MDICIPEDTDWSARFATDADVIQAKADPEMGAKMRRAEMFAWSLLAALCAYRIGTCPITVRPCSARCAPGGPTYLTAHARGGNSAGLPRPGAIGQLNPYISGGRWYNACGCTSGCECSSVPEVHLPGPVGSIVRVRVDGEELDRSAYRVVNGSRLLRTDGGNWPVCQDLSLDDEDGFSVTYYRGAAPNTMTKYAAGVLANEFLLAGDGDDSCRLPSNLTGMVRSGESYDFQQSDFAEGNTGIPEVQALIRIYNPNQLKSPVIVASPDAYGPAVTTWR